MYGGLRCFEFFSGNFFFINRNCQKNRYSNSYRLSFFQGKKVDTKEILCSITHLYVDD